MLNFLSPSRLNKEFPGLSKLQHSFMITKFIKLQCSNIIISSSQLRFNVSKLFQYTLSRKINLQPFLCIGLWKFCFLRKMLKVFLNYCFSFSVKSTSQKQPTEVQEKHLCQSLLLNKVTGMSIFSKTPLGDCF